MQWLNRRESGNVEDRRGMSGGKLAIGGGAVGLILFIVIKLFFGGDPSQILDQLQQKADTNQSSDSSINAKDDEMAHFVAVVLADNEDVWNKLFSESGLQYKEPKLVLFRDATESACGNAFTSTGPFYCPADHRVYIDLAFFDELKNRFGAKGGDFAVAYVVSHEVGHHVQTLLGTAEKVRMKQERVGKKEANRLSVAMELQADFYAGIWAHYDQKMKNVLEEGDIEEALSAASAVGDDHLQKQSQGYIVPDSFTHGTSEQRVYWFKLGFQTGDLKQGEKFKDL